MICNKQVAVKGFYYAEVHTVCLQVRTGHTKAISLLHRLHIMNIVVSKKSPGFCTETGNTTVGNSAAGI